MAANHGAQCSACGGARTGKPCGLVCAPAPGSTRGTASNGRCTYSVLGSYQFLAFLSLSWSFEGSSGGVWPRARARVEQSINSTYPLPLQAARARVRARVACGSSVGLLWVLVRADVLQLQAARARVRARVGRWCSDGVPMVLLCADVLKTPGRSRACVRARVERWCFGGVLGVLVCVRVLHHLARVCAPAR